jgi:hypothetical protein
MPIDVFWDDEAKTILRANFSEPWSWEEFHAAIQYGWRMSEAVEQRVIKLNDMRSCTLLPPGDILAHIGAVNNNVPDFKAVITIGKIPIISVIMPIARQISGIQNRFLVDTYRRGLHNYCQTQARGCKQLIEKAQ